MDRAGLMEYLIRPFAGKDRATAMVGDLLESNPSDGRFWASSLMLLILVAWRTCAALLLAYAVFCVAWIPAIHGWAAISRQMWIHTGATTTWAPNAEAIGRQARWAFLLGCIAQMECVSAAFAVILYGFRESLTLVSLLLAGLSITLCWYLPSPPIRFGLLCGLAIVVGGILAKRASRRPFAALAVAICTSLAFGALILKLAMPFHQPSVTLAALGTIPLVDVFAVTQFRRVFAARD
jgi:hypothetical protein